ncbi:MAG TPA: hypothetical protein H9830_02395 [Candidatus Agrococcus pullicola]|uniref:Signal transduction histidine kinase subgroup 3 dimerisation and phosphoacceptor domain-containing protein n=1 Tax=Candidatus Agrococcus pullicola TaxID=2838429 RepID=A0A9D1YT30_9MICO|nr:hypothetical protein [Candidatus Agrococcus pullicola]
MSVHESRPMRRMRKITTIGAVIAVAVAGITQLLVASDPLWHSALQLPSVAIATWAASRWQTGLTLRQLLPAVAIGSLTWVTALLLGMGPLSLIGLVVPVAVTIATMRKYRAVTAAAFVLAVPASSLLVTAVRPDSAEHYLFTSLTYTLMFTGVFWLNDVTWRLFSELETMRRTETELAIIKERFRFASDLHDIQGHTLHVIKLKAAVAARLQHTDPERTAAELEAIGRLTAQTIEQARDLANSTHSLTFASELANASELLDAAGIRVDVHDRGRVPDAHDGLFALVLREATTNVLRHTRATEVSITVDDGLSVRNDGAAGEPGALRGLESLRTRVRDAGGTLDIEHGAGRFELRLHVVQETV